ncbi:reverse transcriptase domain-containing protein [Tanacetum coccineum]
MVEVAKEVAEVAREMAKVAKGVVEVAKEVVEVIKKVIKVIKVVVEVTERMEVVVESLTLLPSSLNNCKIYYLPFTMNNGRGGCSYKEFMACSLKDYDRKGGAIVYTRWIEKMQSVQDMSGCEENQKVKYTFGSFIGKVLTWWNSQVQTRGREATVGMTWEGFKTLTREELCPNNEMQKLETEFWCHTVVGVGHTAYTDRFQELARLVPHLVTPKRKRIKRYIYGLASQIRAMVAATEPTKIQSAVQKARMLTDEEIRNEALNKITEKRWNNGEPSRKRKAKDDNKRSKTGRVFATITNPVRKEYTGPAPKCANFRFHHNPEMSCLMAIKGGQGRGNNRNQARGVAFMMGAEEARQDPNIMTGFNYEIEIASRQLVEFNKVIRSCRLEIEGHIFNIDLILFGHGSFDVIVGMDWLSKFKSEIVCHEKVDRIPLPNGKILRVLGEKPEEKVRYLMSTKTKEPKQKDTTVVSNFPEVFLDNLSGLLPTREFEYHIDLIPGAMPVAKSPYRLTPSKMEELSS